MRRLADERTLSSSRADGAKQYCSLPRNRSRRLPAEFLAMHQLILALALCSADFARPHCENCPPDGMGLGMGGEPGYRLVDSANPCYRGKQFRALAIARAYRDNEAFAYQHFEDKRITVTMGRIVSIKKQLAVPYVEVDPVTKKPVRLEDGSYSLVEKDVFVALVTPTGDFPPPALNPITGAPLPQNLIGLEFRFPLETLKNNPQLRCALAELPTKVVTVTLRGDCRGAAASPDGYTAIIFENAEIVP
jgi:hypothetical protein